mgnify:CR=1 FL=1
MAALLSRTLLLAPLALSAIGSAHAAASCSARSAATITPVVELYTSEGCNSCPPADRWLSTLKPDAAVVALAFHVDYWDRLGWKDRFASPSYTRRQSQQLAPSGARFAYTPQVMIDGVDQPDWLRAAVPAASARQPALVDVQLRREGQRVDASIAARAGSPTRLAAYWAVTEQGHASAVRAGENQGATLRHDFVVREYVPVAAWASRAETVTLRFEPASAADPAHPRQINLVIVDADRGRPVQALKLGC